MRKLVTVRKILEIKPIENADAIELAIVDGWQVVTKKGEYSPGDLALYAEIDSWIPHHIAPFLTKGKEPREYNGAKGERLRTVRLRKQLSQGLLLPMSILEEHTPPDGPVNVYNEGDDVTEILGVQKWEAPAWAQLAGRSRGNFPAAIPKTDQERAQNIKRTIEDYIANGDQFEITEKLEGSSMTCFIDAEGVFHVCSRNLDLAFDETNTFWATAIKYDVEARMRSLGLLNVALQGELIGPGVQGNIYRLEAYEYHVFDVYDATTREYLLPGDRVALVAKLGLPHAPVYAAHASFKDTLGINTLQELIEFSDGKSFLNPDVLREGLVFKHVDTARSFKAVSNLYLEGEK